MPNINIAMHGDIRYENGEKKSNISRESLAMALEAKLPEHFDSMY